MIPAPPRPTVFPYTTLFRSYDPTAAAALEMMRAMGQPTPNPRMGPVPRAPYTAPMPPGWVGGPAAVGPGEALASDRKSTRLNSSHQIISYAVFCLKKKN